MKARNGVNLSLGLTLKPFTVINPGLHITSVP